MLDFEERYEEYEIGGRCDVEYACHVCGARENWADDTEEERWMQMYRLDGDKTIYCALCLKEFLERKQKEEK